MLPEPGKTRISESEPIFGSVHNYYENLVFSKILESSPRARQDSDFAADVACVALNQLPSRYVRHEVDLAFFLLPSDIADMASRVDLAVQEALAYVETRLDQSPLGP